MPLALYRTATTRIPQRERWIVPLFLLLDAAIRLCGIYFFPKPFVGDMLVYERLGLNLLAGHGFTHLPSLPPTATQMPLYPLFISLIYTIFGKSHIALFLVQTGIDVATAFIIYLTAKRLFQSVRPGYVALLLWAAYLPAAELVGTALTETLFTFFVIISIYMTIVFIDKPRASVLFFAGIFLGFAALTRPVALGFAPFLILPLVLFLPRRRLTIVASVLFFVGVAAVLSPWVVRNYRCFHTLVPTTTRGGEALYQFSFRIAERDFTKRGTIQDFPPDVRSFLEGNHSEVEKDKFLRDRALRLVRAYPLRYVQLCLYRFPRFWFNVGYGSSPSVKSLLFMAGNLLLMGFATFGVFSKRLFRSPMSWPLISFVLYMTLAHMTLIAFGRYSIPAIPALIVLSSRGIVEVTGFLASGLRGSRIAVA